MVFTTWGRTALAYALGSQPANNFISYFAVGSGSGTELNSNVTLVNEFTRFAITGSPDFTTARKVTFTGDLNALTASGLILKEVALLASGPALVGSVWSRDTVANGGSVVFDGTLEGHFEYTVEIQ